MTRRTLTVGGLPGTGTTTLCRIFESELGLPYVYAGAIYREQAAERGMTLLEFNALCEKDSSVDRSLEDRQLELLRQGGVILEGRLSGWLAHTHAVPAFKTWVTCDTDERVRRVVEREGGDQETQRRQMLERESRDADRWRRYYGADLEDLAIFDLVLDSSSTPARELADRVLAALPEHVD